MRPPAAALHIDGRGPDVVFVHGTAGDKASWGVLIPRLRHRVRATAYDRRGAGAWPLDDDEPAPLVADHVADAADVILALGTAPVHLCAMSFGAVIVLELLKRRPELVRSAVLFEPAVSGDDRVPSVPAALLEEVERLIAAGEPARAADAFYRRMLGEAAWSRLPPAIRAEMAVRGRQIWRDLRANASHRVGYGELGAVQAPVLLLQGARSRAVFERSLQALHAALPHARRERLATAEHIPRGEAWDDFAAALTRFVGV